MICQSLAIFLIVLHFLYTENKKTQEILWLVACFSIFFIVGFRTIYTGDTLGYVLKFINIETIKYNEIFYVFKKDPGFYILVKTISLISKDPLFFLASTAFLSLYGVFDFIKRNSSSPILALYFYVTLCNFSFILTGIRQSIAMSICLIATRFIESRKFIHFAILVAIAATQHKSAWLFMLTYFLGNFEINKKNLYIQSIAAIFILLNYGFFLSVVNENLGYEYDIEEMDNGRIFMTILILIMSLVYKTKKSWCSTNKHKIAVNMSLTATLLFFLRQISRVAERPAMYWLNAIPVVLTESLNSSTLKKDKLFLTSIIVLLSLILFLKRAAKIEYSFYW